jgi:hypothetical protein
MPANGIFTLGVGHVRRKTIEPGDKSEQPAQMIKVGVVDLSDLEWEVLLAHGKAGNGADTGVSDTANGAR